MDRCPCCNARLHGEIRCPRCSAELNRIIRCEHLAKLWLSAALQFLRTQEPVLAIQALNQSLRYKQSQSALIFRDFLMRRQNQPGL